MDDKVCRNLFEKIIALDKAFMDHLEKVDELLGLLVQRVNLIETNMGGIDKELEILFNRTEDSVIVGVNDNAEG